MLHVDPKMPATVFTLSPNHGNKTVTTRVRGTSLKNAVRFVMERLPNVERSRSLIRTATHSLYFAEIERSTGDRNFSMKTLARQRRRWDRIDRFRKRGNGRGKVRYSGEGSTQSH